MNLCFKVGTRGSRLARIQTESALARIIETCPPLRFDTREMDSPGDRDRGLDLRESPADFFTRDLDEAILAGRLDCAIHSAKDVPDPAPPGLDWFWLPWREDPRDVLVAAPGKQIQDLPARPRIGVSSVRRETYCGARFREAELVPVRGNIEERIRQVDNGTIDMIVTAAAALIRLGLTDRITEWIPFRDLPTADGQGALAMTFRAGDARFLRLRSLFLKALTFVGAGAGRAELCTVAGIEALHRCEACLFDLLLDPALLDHVPAAAFRLDVGKRCASAPVPQEEISELLVKHVRRGLRVVRLKGGDPGIFGRLAEETEALEALHLPYRIVPGVSSLGTATTGTGMFLTRRGVSPGFCVMTAREKGGKTTDISSTARAALPCVFFMGTSVIKELVDQLLADGIPPETPAALVLNAGGDDEKVIRATLGAGSAFRPRGPSSDPLSSGPVGSNGPAGEPHGSRGLDPTGPEDVPSSEFPPSGLFIVGDIARFGTSEDNGALQGKRILLTCSDSLLGRAVATVRDLGGRPVPFPLIRLVPAPGAGDALEKIGSYDWIVITSPSAARALVKAMKKSGDDLRNLPRIAVSGPGTAKELRESGLNADICPDADFGGDGLVAAIQPRIKAGNRVLRLRSDKAGPALAEKLRSMGADVDDRVLYRNEPVCRDHLPEFNAVFFASASAVDTFVAAWGIAPLDGKTVTVIGPPAQSALEGHGREADVVPTQATVESSVFALASRVVVNTLEENAG